MKQQGRQGLGELMAMDLDSVGYYIAPRPGVRGGKVDWAQMERWLDVRTLSYRLKRDSLWVLFDTLGMDLLLHVRGYGGGP